MKREERKEMTGGVQLHCLANFCSVILVSSVTVLLLCVYERLNPLTKETPSRNT